MRASILMPVAGYLILLNEDVVRLAQTAPEFRFLADYDPLRLILFYFGTFFLAVASIVFAACCPGPCRKYDTAVDYTNSEGAFFTANPLILQGMVERRIVRHRPDDAYIDRDRLDQAFRTTTSQVKSPYPDRLEATTFVMDQFWHMNDPDQPFYRIVCRVFYDAGFALVALPAFWTLLGVLHFIQDRYL